MRRTKRSDLLTPDMIKTFLGDEEDFETLEERIAGELGEVSFEEIANVLVAAMDQLTEQGKVDFILLRYEGVRNWWQTVQDLRAEQQARGPLQQKLNEFFQTLTPAERNILSNSL